MIDFASRETAFSSNLDQPHVGWMSPDGKFYYTCSMEHLSFAREVSNYLYKSDAGDEALYAHQWLAIHPYGMCGSDYLFVWRGHLTEEQKRVVKPFVEKYIDWIGEITKYDLLDELGIEYKDEYRISSPYMEKS